MIRFLRTLILRNIEREGRNQGSPTIKFDNRKIFVAGENLYAGEWWPLRALGANAFYLPLPSNAYGVVIYPDGTTRNLAGGLHEVPPGLYKLQYVDKHERFDVTAPISEMALDGEKLTLTVMVRYRVTEPITALRIDKPIETLIEHLQTDVAQYIRTHNHNDVADAPEANGTSKILSFFTQRHADRFPLSRAIAITGIELKEFAGDMDYINIRRNDLIQQQQDQINKQQLDRQKDIEKLKAEHKVAMDTISAKAAAEQMALRSEILHETQKRDIQLDELRQQSQRRHELVVKAVDAISQALEHSGYSRNSAEIKSAIGDLLSAVREDRPETAQPSTKNTNNNHPRTASNDKIEDLTNTLLNLLKPRK
ncbi:MAG: hypothetical protein JNM02_00520 [Anaerolineales bacterium]|nr:hypothetical protein [Anaerolineales bacterium]